MLRVNERSKIGEVSKHVSGSSNMHDLQRSIMLGTLSHN